MTQTTTKASQTNGTGPAPAPQGHTEAPASASAKMTSPNGIEWLLTVRDDQVRGLLKKIGGLEAHLLKDGWTAAPVRGQAPQGAPAAEAPQGAPVCPYHGPMKPSTKAPGTWYCSSKMADGSYCKEKA